MDEKSAGTETLKEFWRAIPREDAAREIRLDPILTVEHYEDPEGVGWLAPAVPANPYLMDHFDEEGRQYLGVAFTCGKRLNWQMVCIQTTGLASEYGNAAIVGVAGVEIAPDYRHPWLIFSDAWSGDIVDRYAPILIEAVANGPLGEVLRFADTPDLRKDRPLTMFVDAEDEWGMEFAQSLGLEEMARAPGDGETTLVHMAEAQVVR